MATQAMPMVPQPESPELTQQQRDQVVPETEQWSDERAAAIAIADFRKDENYRSQNHDWRYRTADELFLGWVPRRTWEGTKIPRSAVAVHMVLEQVEAYLPSTLSGLFPDEGDLPFTVEPETDTTVDQANATRDLISAQLRNIGSDNEGIRDIIQANQKSKLIYGNGVTEFSWMNKIETREVWQRLQVPERQLVNHPQVGPFMAPTGRMLDRVTSHMQQVPVSRPCLQNIDIRDFYWDANCASHNIQQAGHCETRHFLTINQITQFRGVDGFRIPSDDVLLQLARNKRMTQADNTKAQVEAYRGMTWQPYIDQSIDPNLARVELIRYFQKNRIVWIIRGWNQPLYNRPNPYGVLPFLTSVYVDVPGRWAGISLPDLVETDQHLVRTILNARCDELALLIHPPIIKKRGFALPLSQQRMRPGLMWESDDPKNDFVKMEMGNVTAQAFVEVDAAERRTQKKTGITDLAVLGTPSAGGNSANRTATGIQSQGAASGKRIQYQVENDECWLIVPMLNAIHAMNQRFLDPQAAIKLIGQNAQNLVIDPVDILNASVRFKMTASGRMRQKAALQGGGMLAILQGVFNPEVLQLMMEMGIKPNIPEYTNLITDTFNIPRKTLFIPMTPQEMQQQQQQKMAPDMIRMQMQQDRLQAQGEHQDAADETTLLMGLLQKLITPQVAHELLNQMVGTKLDTHSGKEPKQLSGSTQ